MIFQRLQLANNLLELSKILKKGVGGLIFFYCFSFLPFYSFKIQDCLNGNWEILFQVTCDATIFLCFLLLAAEASSQVLA